MSAADRTYPHSIEYERALLGGLMLNPSMLREVSEIARGEDFYRREHQLLFELLRDMDAAQEPIDTITVPERVARDGQGERYGGLPYVIGLPEHAPATSNLEYYAQVIQQKALARRFIQFQQELVQKAFDQIDEPAALLEQATSGLFNLSRHQGRHAWAKLSLVIDEELMRMQAMAERPAGLTGVPSGFSDLDQILLGLQRGDLIILAARPGMGKTSFALNVAQQAALCEGVAVGVFSLEMSRQQLTARMLATQAMVDSQKMRVGKLDADEWEHLFNASDLLRTAKIHIDDSPGLTMRDLRTRARRLVTQEGSLGLIVVDYLQLMQHEEPSLPRTQQVSDISRGLKLLAKEMDVPVIALSQLSRDVEKRQDKRPIPSDLRDSGAIEQDADVILFIYRDDKYNHDSPDKGLAEIIISKHRHGETGTVKLVFQGQYTKFANLNERDDGRL